MAQGEKRKVGRPSTKDRAFKIEFEIDRQQAAFMLELGARLGWGTTENAVAKTIVVTEIAALQAASARANPDTLPRND